MASNESIHSNKADTPGVAVATLDGPPAYTGKRSWFRSTFFQATIVGFCSLCAPGIWGAMMALGAGGQTLPGVSWGNTMQSLASESDL